MAYPVVPVCHDIPVPTPEPLCELEEPVSPVLMTAAQRKMLKQQQRKEKKQEKKNKEREEKERRERMMLQSERELEQAKMLKDKARDALEKARDALERAQSVVQDQLEQQQQVDDQGAQQTPVQAHPQQQQSQHDQIASSQPEAHNEQVWPREEPGQLKNHLSSSSTTPRLPPTASFKTVRAKLIRQAHIEILNGGTFADTNIHLYSRRNRAGFPYAPRVLALNKRILEAASSQFGEYVFSDTVPVDSDGYMYDSDLEDDDMDDIEVPGSFTVTSSLSDFDYQELETPKIEEDRTTQLGDVDLLTDDEIERPPQASGRSTPATISRARRGSPEQPRIVDGAFKTWQAMSLFLYTDSIEFDPLRSYSASSPQPPLKMTSVEQSPCSPKSMYRLADRLRLIELREQAQVSLKSYLTEANIVDELFSDFTWSYPEILGMESDVFYQHSTHPSVTSAMRRVFGRIAKGELPHSDVVLDVLFGRLTQHLPPART